ncbi:MAG: hypothetical protein G3W58_22940 [Pantoea ananatis]|nr:hypothetical protein [Pantoea ananatis]
MKADAIDYDNLPKWVVGGIDPVTGLLGFGKTFEVDSEGNTVNWRIDCFHTKEEAQASLDSVPDELNGTGYQVMHLDDLCRELIRLHTAP